MPDKMTTVASTYDDKEALCYFFDEEELGSFSNDYDQDIEYDLKITIERIEKEKK